jgi:hypothetical protein
MLIFTNPGIIDPRSISTFGVNAKASTNPIGHFGTGLKYAIATILRNDGSITIKSGPAFYHFSTLSETVRGEEFHFIYMNNDRLGFTTELGKEWKPWQAYRELWSNCMDEGGEVLQTALPITLPMGEPMPPLSTLIAVNWPELNEVHANQSAYILPPSATCTGSTAGGIEIYPIQHEARPIFYRGIRVNTCPKPALFSYNILTQSNLTEDRTLDYFTCGQHIAQGIAMLEDATLLDQILQASEITFEHSIDFSYISNPSEHFSSAVLRASKAAEFNKSAKRRMESLNPEAYLPAPLTPTDEELTLIEQGFALLAAGGLEHNWTSYRVVEFTNSYTQFKTLPIAEEELGILYIDRNLLVSDIKNEFFIELFKYWTEQNWVNSLAERFVRFLLLQSNPEATPIIDLAGVDYDNTGEAISDGIVG